MFLVNYVFALREWNAGARRALKLTDERGTSCYLPRLHAPLLPRRPLKILLWPISELHAARLANIKRAGPRRAAPSTTRAEDVYRAPVYRNLTMLLP